jgi:hypothetical protein
MSRNVMLLGGPANGQMVKVEDGQTAIHVCCLESMPNLFPNGNCELANASMEYLLYWQNEHDKNIFNYAH